MFLDEKTMLLFILLLHSHCVLNWWGCAYVLVPIMNNLELIVCQWLHFAWVKLRRTWLDIKGWDKTSITRTFWSEFQLVAMEANATTPLFIIILPSIKENKEEDFETNPFEHLLAIDEQSLHFITTIDYNVWLSSSQVGHQN